MHIQILIEDPHFVKETLSKMDNLSSRCDEKFFDDQKLFGEIIKFILDLNSKMECNLDLVVDNVNIKQNGHTEYIKVGSIGGYLSILKKCIEDMKKYQLRPNKYSSRIENVKEMSKLYMLNIYKLCHSVCYMCDFNL